VGLRPDPVDLALAMSSDLDEDIVRGYVDDRVRALSSQAAQFDHHRDRAWPDQTVADDLVVEHARDTVQVPGRAGLAANQTGSGLAVFAYNVDGYLGYVINPRITEVSGSQEGPEACLSIPGVSAIRRRAAHATVVGTDLDQRPVIITGTGELARCLQHETDHLRGELYIDRLGPAERGAIMRAISPAP
jgi:peptide deformylase